jgi:nicotinamidase/pyrazinamidase
MEETKILFWNVDTQVDFIEPEGKLYVSGAEKLKPVLAKITRFAAENKIRVVNTCDYHKINSQELSNNPDYKTSFPTHCIAGTAGADFIPETKPELPVIIEWDSQLAIFAEFDDPEKYRNIVIQKDAFDVFEGNPYTTKILDILKPGKTFVYGVTTNICVDKAVLGLVREGYKVFVIEDAIKELPGSALPYENWKLLGVEMITFANIKNYIFGNDAKNSW